MPVGHEALSRIPHKQVGPLITEAMPAQHGVGAFMSYQYATACGDVKPATLTTPTDHYVRCPECKAAIAAATKTEGT